MRYCFFDKNHYNYINQGRIAQLVEQKTLNLLVGGSSPPAPTLNTTLRLVDLV